MNRKRWLISALSALMGLSLVLAGCGSTNGSSASSASPNPSSAPANSGTDSSASSKPVTIHFESWYTKDYFQWDKVYAAFHKEYPNINVVFDNFSEKMDSQETIKKLDLAVASGDNLDVIMVSNPADYIKRINAGVFAPLDPYIDFKKGEYKTDTAYNGKYYALPGKFAMWYVLLNKDELDKANLKVPSTWDWTQFEQYAKALTNGSGAQKHYGTYFHTWQDYFKLAITNLPELNYYLKPDGTSNMDNPGWQQTLEIRKQMESVDKSAIPYADAVSQKMNYRDQFFNDKVSMIITGTWMTAQIAGTKDYPFNFHVAAAPYPVNKAGDPNYSQTTVDYYGIANNSKNKKAAYDFIRWMTTKGIDVQGTDVSSWKTGDTVAEINNILKNGTHPELVDKASLIHTFQVTQATKATIPVPYDNQLATAVQTQFEKFMLSGQNMDTTLTNMKKSVQDLIDANKK